MKDLEHVEQMGTILKVQRPPTSGGESSDGRMFIGNREHDESETHNQYLEDKVVGDENAGGLVCSCFVVSLLVPVKTPYASQGMGWLLRARSTSANFDVGHFFDFGQFDFGLIIGITIN